MAAERLSEEEIVARLLKLSGRSLMNGSLHRVFEFKDFSVQLRDKLVLCLNLQPLGESGIYDWEERKYEPDMLSYMAELL